DMDSESISNTYRKVRIEPQVEIKAIAVLRRSGESFRAVSKTEYFISGKQCEKLNSKKIPYEKL
ncbi:MAG: hypothetical protein KGI09_07095, partial [Thaumarchaeota archaeon]|nr:hypothetical protein [Nitrososphaerota archaeon]